MAEIVKTFVLCPYTSANENPGEFRYKIYNLSETGNSRRGEDRIREAGSVLH